MSSPRTSPGSAARRNGRRRPLSRAAAVVLAAALTCSATALPAPAAEAARKPAPDAGHSLRQGSLSKQNFYFVMADRFSNGTTANDTGGLGTDPLVSGFDPTRKGYYNGGDLKGLQDRLDYIKGLGTNAVWLTPSFKNKAVQGGGQLDNSSAGYHGYWVTDFTQIDPHLGTNAELKSLIDAAHARGMKVYFDIITNHTADVIQYKESSSAPYISKATEPYRSAAGEPFDDHDYAGTQAFPELDAATSFPYTPFVPEAEKDVKVPAWLNDATLYHNRGNTTFSGEDALYGDFFGLDDLFTEHPRVVNGMVDIYKGWIRDFGIDGFRIDTMKHVNDEFWQQFGPQVLSYAKQQGKDEFFMFGEVFDTSKTFTSKYTTRNRMQAVLDFGFQGAARSFASQSGKATGLKDFFGGDDWYTDADSNVYQLPTFLGNHDMGRIGTFISQDNAGAADAELLKRDNLAHELMYFSRGNPVVYYGDEQGFTGAGGDQDSRQPMFASQVSEYLDDDLLGTDATHATDNFNTAHPLYRKIAELAALTKEHTALRDGAQQHRYASDGPGIYAFSRTDAKEQREYVVALNNSETTQTAAIPTYRANAGFKRIYGDAAKQLTTAADSTLTVTVPPLSAVVYRAVDKLPVSTAAPAVALGKPATSAADSGRIKVGAAVESSAFNEVSFEARVPGGDWQRIGVDDNAPYQVFHDVSALAAGTAVEYRAVVLDNAGHTAVSDVRSGVVGEAVQPDSVTVAGSLNSELGCDSDWQPGCAEAGMSYDATHRLWVLRVPDLAAGHYEFKAALNGSWDENYGAGGEPNGANIALDHPGGAVTFLYDHNTNVIRAALPGPQPGAVSAPGSLNSELGCAGDWMPDCAQAQLTFDPADGLWKLTAELPAGSYEFKAALNGSWAENYGLGGAANGNNIVLNHPGGPVTFSYDHASHLITAG
ncbi:alpha-amylase [Arthrobacter sp. SW1]|uniref:alpha-amylase family glycosyl hydrolase n=1 Tax=Arthrobacter sp. SW1 TaxID=1920889 RepID=UPI000877BD26|nr:alpha-amylase family glycosyl hydrolase [Arthrobacter sp. SW1]OFI39327.1 alpha-amylase [Arthrobacter sp. SW1]